MKRKTSGIFYPTSDTGLISCIYSSVKYLLACKAKGLITLHQALYFMQWAHSVFKLHTEKAGLIYCEKYLFYLKAEKHKNENNLSALEQLCIDGRMFPEKTMDQGLWQPSHPKMLAGIYQILAQLYITRGDKIKARENLENSEKVLVLLLAERITYTKAQHLLASVQFQIKSL